MSLLRPTPNRRAAPSPRSPCRLRAGANRSCRLRAEPHLARFRLYCRSMSDLATLATAGLPRTPALDFVAAGGPPPSVCVTRSRELGPSAVASSTSQRRSDAGSPVAAPHVRSARLQRRLPPELQGRPQPSLTWVRMPWAPRRTPSRPWDWPPRIVPRRLARRSTGSSAACPWRPGPLFGNFHQSVRTGPVRWAQASSLRVSSARSPAPSRPDSTRSPPQGGW